MEHGSFTSQQRTITQDTGSRLIMTMTNKLVIIMKDAMINEINAGQGWAKYA